MDDAWKIIGVVCRYIMAALACWWFFWFITLIGASSDNAQYLAGIALGKAIICGGAAGIWFYRARRAKQAQKLDDYSVLIPQPAGPAESKVPQPPARAEETQVVPVPESSQESQPTKIEEPPKPEDGNERGTVLLIVGGAIASVVLVGLFIAISSQNGGSGSNKSLENSIQPQTAQSGATLPDGFVPVDRSATPDANAQGANGSNATSACPTSLPAGVSSKPLPSNQLSGLEGWEGSLFSWDGYGDDAQPIRYWKALFGYKNMTASCITAAVVELGVKGGVKGNH